MNQSAYDKFLAGFQLIIEGIEEQGYDPKSDDNFRETAARAAKGFAEIIQDKRESDAAVAEMLQKTFPARYSEMVISKHNAAFGVCPHHLLPVIYRISLAYIPKTKVLGLSKLSRIAKLKARAPVLQEDLTHQLTEILYEQLDSEGAAVYIEGLHMCMATRGIGAHEARLVTSAVRGEFLTNSLTRQEFIKLVTADHPRLV